VASAAALEEVRGAFQDLGSPTDPLLTPDGALREFLHSTSVYSQDRFDVKPYSRDVVSWPPVGSKAVSLADGLPEADRSLLADWKTHMLRSTLDNNTLMSDLKLSHNLHSNTSAHEDTSSKKVKKAYCDPALFRNTSVYADFLRRLDAGGMLHWVPAHSRRGVLGVFFVAKKDGSLRLIFDTRILNHDFIDPPHTALPSGAAFSSLEVERGSDFYFGSFDIRNAFYVLGIPLDLAEKFSLLPSVTNTLVSGTYMDAKSGSLKCSCPAYECCLWAGRGHSTCASCLPPL